MIKCMTSGIIGMLCYLIGFPVFVNGSFNLKNSLFIIILVAIWCIIFDILNEIKKECKNFNQIKKG